MLHLFKKKKYGAPAVLISVALIMVFTVNMDILGDQSDMLRQARQESTRIRNALRNHRLGKSARGLLEAQARKISQFIAVETASGSCQELLSYDRNLLTGTYKLYPDGNLGSEELQLCKVTNHRIEDSIFISKTPNRPSRRPASIENHGANVQKALLEGARAAAPSTDQGGGRAIDAKDEHIYIPVGGGDDPRRVCKDIGRIITGCVSGEYRPAGVDISYIYGTYGDKTTFGTRLRKSGSIFHCLSRRSRRATTVLAYRCSLSGDAMPLDRSLFRVTGD